MARLVRYDVNMHGMDALANSRAIDSMLETHAEAIAATARSGYDRHPPHAGEVQVEVLNGGASDSDRARVAVLARHPGALGLEARWRILGRAVSAARGAERKRRKATA